MTARDIMTTNVVSVGEEVTVAEVADLLVAHSFDAVPVVDATGRVLGLVSYDDLIRLVLPEFLDDIDLSFLPASAGLFPGAGGREGLGDLKARDVMRRDELQEVPPGEPIAEVARLMLAEGVRRVVVVEEDRLVGIVSRGDIVRAVVHPRLSPDSQESP
jgi:CBS domain-containing protein